MLAAANIIALKIVTVGHPYIGFLFLYRLAQRYPSKNLSLKSLFSSLTRACFDVLRNLTRIERNLHNFGFFDGVVSFARDHVS